MKEWIKYLKVWLIWLESMSHNNDIYNSILIHTLFKLVKINIQWSSTWKNNKLNYILNKWIWYWLLKSWFSNQNNNLNNRRIVYSIMSYA
jgi:hypothetical protein